MKKYGVNVHYDTVLYVEVEADDEDSAIELANIKAMDMDISEADFFDGKSCIVPLTRRD